MLITINIDQKLDLSKFRKQALNYLGRIRELNYHFYLPAYKIIVETATVDDSTAHHVTIYFSEIWRDQDKEIKREQRIFPATDTRFAESKIVKTIWNPVVRSDIGYFISNSVAETTDKICQVVKLVFKINSLKAFL
jgi:hypothetical protein